MTPPPDVLTAPPEIGEWLSIRDAAARLGITERTVFRKLNKGTLKKQQLADGSLQIFVSGPAADAAPEGDMTVPEPPADPAPQAALIWAAMAEIRAQQQAQIAALAFENGVLRTSLAWHRRSWWQKLRGQPPVMTDVGQLALPAQALPARERRGQETQSQFHEPAGAARA